MFEGQRGKSCTRYGNERQRTLLSVWEVNYNEFDTKDDDSLCGDEKGNQGMVERVKGWMEYQ